MSKKDTCSECRLEQVASGNSHGLCQECYDTIRTSWYKMDRFEYDGKAE